MTADLQTALSGLRRRARLICMFFLMACFAVAASSEELGRFFSTPGERAVLDEIRANRDLTEPAPAPVTPEAPPAPVVEELSIEGLVIRSGGADAAWINGRPVLDGWTTREGVRVDASSVGGSGRVKITLPSGAGTIDLKPGQKIDVDTGVVVEGYQRSEADIGASAFGSTAMDDSASPDGAESGADGG